MSDIGLLKAAPNIFYATVSNSNGERFLFTIDVQDKSRVAAFAIPDVYGAWDFDDFSSEKPIITFTDSTKGIRTVRTATKLYAH